MALGVTQWFGEAEAGNLYNKAPRFSVFGEPMHCQAVSGKP